VTVGAPPYHGVHVVARVRPSEHHEPRLDERCVAALTELLHPLRGGPRRDGWPFGRDVDAFSLATALGVVRGVDEVTEVRLFEADLQTGAVGEPTNRVRIGPGALPLLVRPMVRVTQGEEDLDDVAHG
jgi:hypothetical protein